MQINLSFIIINDYMLLLIIIKIIKRRLQCLFTQHPCLPLLPLSFQTRFSKRNNYCFIRLIPLCVRQQTTPQRLQGKII